MRHIKKFLVVIVLIFVGILSYNHFFKEGKTETDGQVTIIVVNENERVLEKAIEFDEGESLIDILLKEFVLTCYDNNCDGDVNEILIGINEYKTDFVTTYLSVTVNGEYALVGVGQLVVEDGDIITFAVEKIN